MSSSQDDDSGRLVTKPIHMNDNRISFTSNQKADAIEDPFDDEEGLTVEDSGASHDDRHDLETHLEADVERQPDIELGDDDTPTWDSFPSNGGVSLEDEVAEADVIREYVTASRASMVSLSLNDRQMETRGDIPNKRKKKKRRKMKLVNCSKKTERIATGFFLALLVGLLIFFIVKMIVMARQSPNLYQDTNHQDGHGHSHDDHHPPGGHLPLGHPPHHGGPPKGGPHIFNSTHPPHPPHPHHNNSEVSLRPPPTNGENTSNTSQTTETLPPPSSTTVSPAQEQPQLIGFIQAPFNEEELVYLVENNNVVNVPEDQLGDLDASNSSSFTTEGGDTIYCGNKVDGIEVLVECQAGVPLCRVYSATTSDECSQAETSQ